MTRYIPLLLIFLSVLVHAQKPQMLEPGIISNNGEFGFTLSPDGTEAFWVKSNGGRDTLYILHSRKVKGKWRVPEVASFSTTSAAWKDIDPMFSPDGNKVLFQSTRPVPGAPGRKGFDIWAADRTASGWSEAYHLGNVINSDASESFASITKTGSIYFMKENPDGKGSSDIYVSRFENGQYVTPTNIGHPINTSFRESNPYISPDEDYIIYFSSDTTGYGDVDLMLSRNENGRWTAPINLGQPINTELGEFCPFFHKKQKKLYFSRTVETPAKRRIENVYWVRFDPVGGL